MKMWKRKRETLETWRIYVQFDPQELKELNHTQKKEK